MASFTQYLNPSRYIASGVSAFNEASGRLAGRDDNDLVNPFSPASNQDISNRVIQSSKDLYGNRSVGGSSGQSAPLPGLGMNPYQTPQSADNLMLVDTGGQGAAAGAAGGGGEAAANAAEASALRGDVTNLVNRIKDIFNQRYGKVEKSAAEQTGKLDERFATESADLNQQIGSETEKLGAAYAGRGAFDSSYRGNDVDTVTRSGKNQIRDLGSELEENIGKIAAWVAEQQSKFDAEKQGVNRVQERLPESTDPNELRQLRNQLDAKITELEGGSATYNTEAQNAKALKGSLANGSRGVQLKNTLSQVVAGNAPRAQKAAIGQRLINSSGLSSAEKEELLRGFSSELGSDDEETQIA